MLNYGERICIIKHHFTLISVFFLCLCRTFWPVFIAVQTVFLETPAKWRWRLRPTLLLLRLSTGGSKQWLSRSVWRKCCTITMKITSTLCAAEWDSERAHDGQVLLLFACLSNSNQKSICFQTLINMNYEETFFWQCGWPFCVSICS